MKYEVNFAEAAQIFTAIAKAEVKVEEYKERKAEYEAANEEYFKSGYNLNKGMEMVEARSRKNKAAKKVEKACEEIAAMTGILNDNFYIGEYGIRYNLDYKKYEGALYSLKSIAVEMTKYLKLY